MRDCLRVEPGRSWPEDYAHENGRYACRCIDCGNMFIGHKRRVICKLCSRPLPPEVPA